MRQDEESIEELLRATEVGDTIQMTISKSELSAEVRDRIAPVMSPPAEPDGRPIFQGFTKSAGGEWDLERATSAKGATTVEVVVRRIAADI